MTALIARPADVLIGQHAVLSRQHAVQHIRRNFLYCNPSVRPETAAPIRKVIKMSLMIEDLARDRMRRMQRDAELSRAANRLRQRSRLARRNSKAS